MTTLHFHKYQGTSNDFVMLDDRSQQFETSDYQLVHRLCDRRLGIGADGLILLRNHPDYDFEMVYFNADGHLGSMCGNGGRCTVAFAKYLGLIEADTAFLAADGLHEARIQANGTVHLRMQDVAGLEALAQDIFVNTGSPHVVRFLPAGALATHDVFAEGRAVRYNEPFKEHGTNVNFVEAPAEPSQPWQVRTYERGVEDETFSCGTGVTAVALAAARQHGVSSPVRLQTPGGELQVAFVSKMDGSFTQVYLSGPATRVFAGTIEV